VYAVVGTMFTGVPSSTRSDETSTEAASKSAETSASETTQETKTEEARTTDNDAASPTEKKAQDDTEAEDPGLSTGVKIGLGVGVGLGAVLLIALAVISWKYHKARKEKQAMPQPVQRFHDPEMVYQQNKFEPASGKPMDYAHFGYVREMPGTTVSWQNQHAVHELSASPSMHGQGRPY
jgi:hypothetical protein